MSSAFVLSDSFGFPTGVIASPTPNETIGAHCGSLCGDWDRLMEAWPIPPPPLPSFFPGDTPPRIAWDPITNESCNFCDWARGEDSVDFIELSHPDPPVDDTLFIVITACCIGGTLLGLLATMLILRYRRAQSKFTIGKVSSKLPTSSSSFTCDGVLYGSTVTPPAVAMTGTTSSRALWAGIRANGTNQYTVDHLQPLEQRQCQPDFNFTTADKKIHDFNIYQAIPNGTDSPAKQISSFDNCGFEDDSLRGAQHVNNYGTTRYESFLLKRVRPIPPPPHPPPPPPYLSPASYRRELGTESPPVMCVNSTHGSPKHFPRNHRQYSSLQQFSPIL